MKLSRHVLTQLLVAAGTSACAMAQPGSPSSSAAPSPAVSKLEEYRKGRTRIYMDDFGEQRRYRAANAKLKPPAAGENRVVFFGDSITDIWNLAGQFPGKPYINRGIGGQTTSQLLVRFRPDVINLRPKVVVILAGTNDIAGNTGPMSLEEIQGNYASLAELARANGIKAVFSSVVPVHNYTPQSELTFPLRPPERIRALNKFLQSFCAANGCVYLDYYAAMIDGKGFLKQELAEDGLHPNKAGYAVMAPLAEKAIAAALAGP